MKPKLVTVAVRRAAPVLGPIAPTLSTGDARDPNTRGEAREVRKHPAQGVAARSGGKSLKPGMSTLIPAVEWSQVAQAAIPPDQAFPPAFKTRTGREPNNLGLLALR